MALNNDHYTYRVTWSQDDEEYVGLCAEFPSLSWLSSSHEAALRGVRKVVADVVVDLEEIGEAIPKAIAAKSYSGKFVVRIHPELHQKLALEAAEAGISLNRLANTRLSKP